MSSNTCPTRNQLSFLRIKSVPLVPAFGFKVPDSWIPISCSGESLNLNSCKKRASRTLASIYNKQGEQKSLSHQRESAIKVSVNLPGNTEVAKSYLKIRGFRSSRQSTEKNQKVLENFFRNAEAQD